MRTTQVWLAVAGAAIAAAALAGCNTVVDGTATCPGCGTGTEPTIPTSRPEAHPPTTPAPSQSAAPPPTATAGPKPGATTLPANELGLVFIETKSGKTRCQLTTASVACESDFANAPMKDGFKANGVSVNGSGTLTWVVGNLGDIPVVKLDYQTYSANGWTIDATSDGTRFSNDGTGHGMQVATQGVQAF